MEVYGNTANEIVREAIIRIMGEGRKTNRWGGTIPAKLGEKAPQNRQREMTEIPHFFAELSNPVCNWTDIGNTTNITFREQEDHFQGTNPGRIILHSKMYREWLNDDGRLPLSYGERLTSYPSSKKIYIDQLVRMQERLKENPSTRKACASLWYPDFDQYVELPACNIFFQASIVDDKLDWTTMNRSLDLFHGLTENIFMFTMWQQELARRLDVEVGTYRVISSNAHIYMDDIPKMKLDLPDPYELSHAISPVKSVEWVLEDFTAVDEALDEGDSDKVFVLLDVIREKDSYWAKFKAAGVADWFINKKEKALAQQTLDWMGDAPWRDGIRRRGKLDS